MTEKLGDFINLLPKKTSYVKPYRQQLQQVQMPRRFHVNGTISTANPTLPLDFTQSLRAKSAQRKKTSTSDQKPAEHVLYTWWKKLSPTENTFGQNFLKNPLRFCAQSDRITEITTISPSLQRTYTAAFTYTSAVSQKTGSYSLCLQQSWPHHQTQTP